jgi:murein L,D-transpeptidase YcbB/YkuD
MESPRASDPYDLDQPSFKFDNSLVEGIKHFQQRFQLPISGKIDVKTLAALNIPPCHMAQKFVLPNDQSIYLHDTNHPELFTRDMRALSSGCIRVEQPKLLAKKIITGQQGWNRSNIDSAISQNRTTHIRLHKPVPVYLMYWTTWVDDNGQLQIRDDVYQRDLIVSLARSKQVTISL